MNSEVIVSFFYAFPVRSGTLEGLGPFRSRTLWSEKKFSVDPSIYPHVRQLFKDNLPISPRCFEYNFKSDVRLQDLIYQFSEKALQRLYQYDESNPQKSLPLKLDMLRAHLFTTKIGLINFQICFECASDILNNPHKFALWRRQVLEVVSELGHVTHNSRKRLSSRTGSLELLSLFRDLAFDFKDHQKLEIEFVRIPTYSLVKIQKSEDLDSNSIHKFAYQLARHHNMGYKSILNKESQTTSFENINFFFSYEGSSLCIEVPSDGAEIFYKNFKTGPWAKCYQIAHLLALHEHFHCLVLSSRTATALLPGSNIDLKSAKSLMRDMRNYLVVFRFRVISAVEQHNRVYQQTRQALQLPEIQADLETDLQALAAEYQLRSEASGFRKLLTSTLVLSGIFVTLFTFGSGLNDFFGINWEVLRSYFGSSK